MTTVAHDPQFESLLDFLKSGRSFDFTGYKRSTLMRRVLKRMQAVEVEGFDTYRDFLEVHPEEFEALFNTILINVTSFFRDAEPWRVLADEFIPPCWPARRAASRSGCGARGAPAGRSPTRS